MRDLWRRLSVEIVREEDGWSVKVEGVEGPREKRAIVAGFHQGLGASRHLRLRPRVPEQLAAVTRELPVAAAILATNAKSQGSMGRAAS